MTNMQSLQDKLQAQELELLALGVSGSRPRLEALLHPEFAEVGRAGHWFDRETCIEFLLTHAPGLKVEFDNFDLKMIEPNVAMLTYRSVEQKADGPRCNHALRFSLWQLTDTGWQLRYHQATPPHQAW